MRFFSLSVGDVKGAIDTPGGKEDWKNTPLLADYHELKLEASHPAGFPSFVLQSQQKSNCSTFRQLWNWVLKDLVTLALSCLLVGCSVAVVFYTRGAFHSVFFPNFI